MTKYFTVVLLILALTCSYAQESVQFSSKVSPNKMYLTEIRNISSSEIYIIADSATLNNIKAKGVELPMLMEQESTSSTISNTGDKSESGDIPFEMQFGKMITRTMINGQSKIEEKPYSGMKILGRYDKSNQVKVDSVVGDNITPQAKKTMLATMESMNQIEFPKERMKIGDKFNSNIPMSIPIEGMQPIYIQMDIEYLLKSIKDGKAIFDVTQAISLDMNHEQVNVEASGKGSGISEYDIQENYMIKYITELPMDIQVKVNEKLTMKMKTSVKSDYIVTIQ